MNNAPVAVSSGCDKHAPSVQEPPAVPEPLPEVGDIGKSPVLSSGYGTQKLTYIIDKDGSFGQVQVPDSVELSLRKKYLSQNDVKLVIQGYLVEATKQVSRILVVTREQHLKLRSQICKLDSCILSSCVNYDILASNTVSSSKKKTTTNIVFDYPVKSTLSGYSGISYKKLLKILEKRYKLQEKLSSFLEKVGEFEHFGICSSTGIEEARKNLKEIIEIYISIVQLDIRKIELTLTNDKIKLLRKMS
ncbi:hypothetical protein FG379_000914 [Cryptosporidium bovis]|uniref:uncharacterized protein n=1 Tax=Cryptosporidium bovis TaxID=310047 RepID=UPI003519D858|nr:hypothetical protein FG379_000914 [Cryptosporidium bovis]